MSRFPDFMHIDLTKLTCGGCLLIVFTVLLALGAAIGVGFLTVLLIPGVGDQGKPGRAVMGLSLATGLAIGAGFFRLGGLLMQQIGLRMYRQGYIPPGEEE